MTYNFDKIINRRNTRSEKWDTLEQYGVPQEALPLWVADMDFPSPTPIIATLKAKVTHGIFGYATMPESWYEAVANWMECRHHWPLNRKWIMYMPGVMPAVQATIIACTQPGDRVIIQPPVYPPFFQAVRVNGCEVAENPLILENGRYIMDFDQLEQLFDARTKVFLLCSPHNPVGRVWTREELLRLGNLCLKHDVILCSDEIHADLVPIGATHIPIASLSAEVADITVTCHSANKTFNLAGISSGFAIIPNQHLFEQIAHVQKRVGMHAYGNLLGVLASEVAYTQCEDWLDRVLTYIHGNLEFLLDYFERHIPRIQVIHPEGTYLAWLDCRELGLNNAGLKDFMLKRAKVWLNDGPTFGTGGTGFQRLNFACPRSTLKEALQRIERAVKIV